ncbi:MAG: transglycosylase SLT domain-containing protein [Alphaproteobacteria bacterium]|nr:transglycosylase SLT domain-containing protein [Alphaproteobacteria bacterium]
MITNVDNPREANKIPGSDVSLPRLQLGVNSETVKRDRRLFEQNNPNIFKNAFSLFGKFLEIIFLALSGNTYDFNLKLFALTHPPLKVNLPNLKDPWNDANIVNNQNFSSYRISPDELEILATIAYLESEGDPNAENPKSSAKGLFQFTAGTAKTFGVHDPIDPIQALEGTIRLLNHNRKALISALGRSPSGAELYLAHQQGHRGAIALLKNPNSNAIDVLTIVYNNRKTAVSAIKNNINRGENYKKITAKKFSKIWIDKFNNVPSKEIEKMERQLRGYLKNTPPLVSSNTHSQSPTSSNTKRMDIASKEANEAFETASRKDEIKPSKAFEIASNEPKEKKTIPSSTLEIETITPS